MKCKIKQFRIKIHLKKKKIKIFLLSATEAFLFNVFAK